MATDRSASTYLPQLVEDNALRSINSIPSVLPRRVTRHLCGLLVLALAPFVASAAQPAVLSGTVLGSDGKPVPIAHVRILHVRSLDPDGGPEVALVRADAFGRFVIASDVVGGVGVELSAPHHTTKMFFAVLEPGYRLRIDARLARLTYRDRLDSVRVIGDFNGFRSDTSARPLRIEPDGRWVLDLATTSDSVAYALIRVTRGGSVPGTSNDRYTRTLTGAYRSVATAYKGAARIVVEPSELRRDTTSESVRYSGGIEARMASLSDSISMWQAMASRAELTGRPMDALAWAPTVQSATRALRLERDRRMRGMRYVALLSLAQLGADVPAWIGAGALRELPPSSPYWRGAGSMAYGLPFVAQRVADTVLTLFRGGEGRQHTRADSLRLKRYASRFAARLDSMVLATTDGYTIAQWLQFGVAVTDGLLPDRASQYLGRMQAEFPDRFSTGYALQTWGKSRRVRPGTPLPAFDVSVLGDTTRRITNAQFAGKTVLIDYWATWCAGCIAEMSVLHDAYNEFKARGIEFLSVSLDGQMADVEAFRKSRWPMPWQHAWVSGSLDAKELKNLELYGIPHTILVGPDGTILAEDRDLRGAALRRTLEQRLK